MQSKVRFAGHPLHAMLVSFPIAFYTAATLAYVFYQYSVAADPFWFRVGYVANIAGVATAVIAAIIGSIDLFAAVPKYNAARKTGYTHMVLNTLSLVLFALSAWLLADQWSVIYPIITEGVYLAIVGWATTAVAGYYGYNLVQKHHVGVDLTLEQNALEPREPQKYFKFKKAH